MLESLAESVLETEPLGYLLARRLRLNTRLRAVLVAGVFAVLARIIIPWVNGFLMPHPGIWSSMEDWAGMFTSFVGIPVTWGFYLFDQPDMIRNVFKGFVTTRTLMVDPREYDEFVSRLRRRLAWKGWMALALFLTAAALTLHARDVLTRDLPSYYCPNLPVFFGLYFVWTGIAIYMIWTILLRHFVVVAAFFALFRTYKTYVYALHPDQCGGLGFMGEFSLRGSYYIAILAVQMTVIFLVGLELNQNPATQPHILAASTAYVFLAPVAFFLPLTPAHSGMLEAKKSAQALISDEASAIFARIQEGLRGGVTMAALMSRLEKLRRLHKLTDSFPVWPLDVGTIQRFVTANIIPFVTFLLELVRHYLQ